MIFLSSLFIQCALLFAVDSFQFAPTRYTTFHGLPKLFNDRHIFTRLFADGGNDGVNVEEIKKESEENEDSENVPSFFPSFLSRLNRRDTQAQDSYDKGAATTSTLANTDTTSNSPATSRKTLSPMEQAEALRAQADKARLEAERMDAELTLQKIARLEKELAHAKAKGSDSVEDLQRQMAALTEKLSGDSKNKTVSQSRTRARQSTSTDISPGGETGAAQITLDSEEKFVSTLPAVVEAFDQNEFDNILSLFDQTPRFLKKLVCAQLGFEYRNEESINATEVALRLDEIRRFDFSFSKSERPTFSRAEIDDMEERLKANWLSSETAYVPDGRLKKAAGGNNTELALMCLEYEYFNDKYVVNGQRMESLLGDSEVIAEISSAIAEASSDELVEALFPPCTRKEGQQATLAQAQKLEKDILPKSQFTSTSKPVAIPGGYIIKGDSKASNGDLLIKSIDEQLEKSSLRGKVTVCYLSDFTPAVVENFEEINFEDFEVGGALFVGGPDLAREPRKVLLSATSALGLSTCWYLSLYPFLLNPTLAKQVDEQLALVEANMPADLSWLSDLSFPLFATFVGLQVLHEVGHRIAAAFTEVSDRVLSRLRLCGRVRVLIR